MIKQRLILAGISALSVMAVLPVQANDALQRVVSSVEYQLTESDTQATGRARAIEKARSEALQSATSDYAITTTVSSTDGISKAEDYSRGKAQEERVLSEDFGSCSTVGLEELQCYSVQLEVLVDAGYVGPTLQELKEAEAALQLVEELQSL
ncbi:hypothetical protein AB6D66_01130 [Vibrio pomeroyi]|uniref:Uncharacterized protein n=1 Tax=Vibrio pomeroyi TaxID=198832 RepID=A0ABV4MR99_9VIBR|nr:hypothetical protein [Vibrio atlanticus]MCZ4310273.1 hypothetical protein [Vibrio atlanticus]